MKSYLNIALRWMLFLLVSSFTFAESETPCPTQDNPPLLIYSNYTQNISWSSGSRYLAFQDFNYPQKVILSEPGWSKYDVTQNALTQENIWPLLPYLTPEENILFKSLTDSEYDWKFISPNEQYVVYQQLSGNHIFITLADRKSRQSIVTTARALNTVSGTDNFNVMWSADSQAFVVATTAYEMSEPDFFTHISNYSNDLSGLKTQELGFLPMNNEEFGTRDIYDLSDDGRVVLVKGYNALNGETRLILWDALDPTLPTSIDIFTETNVIGAAFKSGNENKILVVNQDGLVEYDRQNGSTTVLRTDIGSKFAAKARFSPNAEWLSLKTERELYVVDLRPTLAQTTALPCQADT